MQDLIEILAPIFGQDVGGMIRKYYENEEAEEMLKLSEHMLSGYLGEQIAKEIILKIAAKYSMELA